MIFTADKHQLGIIKQGAKGWNRWREKTADHHPDLSGANLKNTDLRNVDFSWVNLMGANLRNSNLSWANFRRANLRKAIVRQSILRGVNLSWANLSWVDFRGSYLKGANLRRADLSWANLKEVILKEADLREANLSWADLREANLHGADLRKAVLREAYLSNTNFREADLQEADLQEADLRGAHLFKTNLEQANLSGCHIYGISAWGANLHETNQLDLVITDWDEPGITVDNLEVAQWFYLLLHTKELRAMLQTISTDIVLILGCFAPERKSILDTIREELRQQEYLPVFFDCQKTEMAKMMAMVPILVRMARFIIADFTAPQVVLQILPHIVRTISVPIQPLLVKEVAKEPAMIATLRRHHKSVLDTYWYGDSQDLLTSFQDTIIVSAEAKARELRAI